MLRVEPITKQNTLLFKEVRLRALQDAPYAFGSTYIKEARLTDADWNNRVERWNGESGAGFLAIDHSDVCGLAGAFLDERDPTNAHLVSMWTAPTHRERGVGRLLVHAVLDWSGSRHARVLRLMVTSNNESAIRFYEHLGFNRSGRSDPYPNDPDVVEYEMLRGIP